jgi:C4-dicarboxylate transporter DctM subunit
LFIIGGLLLGFFTPTEAGSIDCFAVLVLCMFQRSLSFKAFTTAVSQSVRAACMTLAVLAGSTVLGHFLAITQIPAVTAEWVVGLSLPRHLIMLMIIFIYLLGGSFLDDIVFMILATPIFYPAVIKLGFDPLWFGIIIGVTIMIGVIIPPVAINVFVVKNITKESFKVIYSGVYPFLLGLIGCGILLFLFPKIVAFLPGLLMN